MKGRQQSVHHTGARCLSLLAGMACCLLLFSGAFLPARQAVALRSSFSVYSASEALVSTNNATIQSAEPGRPNGFGDPWVDFSGVNEVSLEEADFSDARSAPVYIAEDVEDSSVRALGSGIPSGPSRSAPLYGLFEVYRL